MRYGKGWHYDHKEIEELETASYKSGYRKGYEQAVRDIKGDEYVDKMLAQNKAFEDEVLRNFYERLSKMTEEEREKYVESGM